MQEVGSLTYLCNSKTKLLFSFVDDAYIVNFPCVMLLHFYGQGLQGVLVPRFTGSYGIYEASDIDRKVKMTNKFEKNVSIYYEIFRHM